MKLINEEDRICNTWYKEARRILKINKIYSKVKNNT